MKIAYPVVVVLLSMSLTARAQSTPEAFISRLPPIPQSAATTDEATVGRFTDDVYRVKAELKRCIEQLHEQAQAKVENLQKGWDERHARQAAENQTQAQYGVSMQELERVGQMSDAEQEKWAQAYADRMTDQAKKDPKAAVKRGDPAARLFVLTEEQKTLGERITATMERGSRLFAEVARRDSVESRELEARIRPLESQLCSGIATPAEVARSRAAEKQIHALKTQYAEKMAPLQLDATRQYLTLLKSLLPDYRRLTVVQNEVARMQHLGDIVPEDLSCLSAVDEYATLLLNVYKYRIGRFEE